MEIQNSIIDNNSLLECGGDPATYITSGGYNLAEDSTCGFAAAGDQQGTEAMLGPLQDNGGPVNTIALLPGSPALEAGNPAVPGSGGTACAATDARLVARPVGERCDIGAFESDYPYSLFLPLIVR